MLFRSQLGLGLTDISAGLKTLGYAVRGDEHAQLGKELQAIYGAQVHLYRKGILELGDARSADEFGGDEGLSE